MKKSMFNIGMICVTVLCALFLFEMAPAQGANIDLSVTDCSLVKIPGTDSVSVNATLLSWVAGAIADSIHFRVGVEVNNSLVYSLWLTSGPTPTSECAQQPLPCSAGQCSGTMVYYDEWGNQLFELGEICTGRWDLCGCENYYHVFPTNPPALIPLRPGDTVKIVVDDMGTVEELDENNNTCVTVYTAAHQIPTLSEWGAIIFGTLLFASVVFYIWRRRRVVRA